MAFKPITVSQLSTYVKQIFDAEELLHGISVVGEISGWSYVRGTAYFTLKDSSSTLSCVCFIADEYSQFKNGDSVMLVGSVKYYTKTGKLNFNVLRIEPYGENVLFQKFLELKAKLEKSGHFAEEHKKQIPKDIKRIGVVSSEGGAVIQDIINVRTRRNPNVDIVLYPVKVQGVNAEYEIAKGIQVLDNYNVDVIVVARGGGSFEDLQPFNTEVVADATYNCNKPIVSAVGHETDFTIIDFCSDLRAPTPSAAAELLCEDVSISKRKIVQYTRLLCTNMLRLWQYKKDCLTINIQNINKNYNYLLENNQNCFNAMVQNLSRLGKTIVDEAEQKINHNYSILKKLDPKEVLKLGYACVKANNQFTNSAKSLQVNDKISICFKDGSVDATVNRVWEDL